MSNRDVQKNLPLETMDHADKTMSLRANNENFTRIVTPHELIPGHHLQGFQTPFLVEGWARGPEDRIGMLFWRMHRCARILVSLGFHLGTMTPDQMSNFLVERVGHERFAATSEVRRYIGGATPRSTSAPT